MKKVIGLFIAGITLISAPQILSQEREHEREAYEKQKQNAMLEEAYQRNMRELELRQMQIEKQMMEEHAAALMAEFSEENEEEGLAFLREQVPWYYDEITALKNSNARTYREKIVEAMQHKWSIYSRAGGDERLRGELLQIYALNLETQRLAIKYGSSDAGQKRTLRSKLRDTLMQLFELREIEREREMVSLEARLTSLQENLRLRKQNKSLIVDNRLKQLLGEASNLEW